MTQIKKPKLSILLCESDKTFCTIFDEYLKKSFDRKVDLVLLESVKASLEYLSLHKPESVDLIVCSAKFDYEGMDGFDFYLHLFAHKSTIPFIALTTNPADMPSRVNNMNFYSFNKGLSIEVLIQFIRRLFPDDC